MSTIQMTLTNTAGISSLISMWIFLASPLTTKFKTPVFRIAMSMTFLCFISLTLTIILRGVEAGRFPLSNLYESLLWFAWATMGGFIYIYRAYGLQQLGWLASLTTMIFFLYGSWLPSSQHTISPLVPALISYWRWIHVPPLIVSYAMFFLAGLTALIQLAYSGRLVSLAILILTIICSGTAVLAGTFSDQISTPILQLLFVGSSIVGGFSSFYALSRINQTLAKKYTALAETLDDVSFRCIAFGQPLLTFGIITGGLWANHAWGSYWSWDPKESMALTTWFSYAIYIHLRLQRDLAAPKLSIMAVIGLLLTLLTYLGFNSLGFGGLHSYGKIR